MSKLTLFGKLIVVLLQKPSVIAKALFHAVRNYGFQQIAKRYGLSNGFKEVSIIDLCPGFDVTINTYTFLNGTSTPPDLALLKYLAQNNKVADYLEIGTWRGESIVNVAPYVTNAVSLSLSKAEMIEMGYYIGAVDAALMFSKDIPNILHIGHNSKTFDFSSLNKKFDLIFVDGDHEYEAVKLDTANVFKLLKDENSIIVWHDYAPAFEVINYQVLAGILDGSPKEALSKIYHVSNTMCAIYTNKPLKTYDRHYPATPNKVFDVTVKVKPIA